MDSPEEGTSNAVWEVSNSEGAGWTLIRARIRARRNQTVLGVLSKLANDHQGACPTLARVNCLDRESPKGLYF